MQKASCLGFAAIAAIGVLGSSASGQVLFSDNFENEPLSDAAGGPPVGAPDIGSWVEAGISQGNGADILDTPALGTRSMRITRGVGTPPSNGQMNGLSLPGALVAGNVVEVQWSNNLTTQGAGHRFNGPIQMSIGHAGSNYSNDLAFIQVADGGNGSYHYNNGHAYNTVVGSGVQPTLNGWDTIRAVLSLVDAGPGQLGGTFDLFASINGGAEQQLANDALLGTTTIPAIDPTVMQLRIGIGPFTSHPHYDNISVNVVPEPSLALGAGLFGLSMVRRRRRS